MAAAAVRVRPLPPYSSGMQRGKEARFGQCGDEFGRIGALAIELTPVLAGEFLA